MTVSAANDPTVKRLLKRVAELGYPFELPAAWGVDRAKKVLQTVVSAATPGTCPVCGKKLATLVNRITVGVSVPALQKPLLSHVLSAFMDGFDATQKTYGFAHSMPDPRSIAYLNERVILLSEKTANRLKGDMKYELVEGMKNGESITQIKQRLAPIFEDMEDYELERLARNEVLNATNEGRMEAYREDGDVKYKVWRAALKDKRTADDSKRLAGQIQPLDKPFIDPLNGKTCDHPPNRPNCRCGTVPLEELPEDIVYRGELMYHPLYLYGGK
jgi:SPP1 gp7 family putative phage head morphogenesis protein